MLEAVQNEGIVVYKKNDDEKRMVNITKGEEAFFALLASDMLELADKYKRDVDEIHKMFFQVNCEREKLIKLLDGQKIEKYLYIIYIYRWQLIEDLAIKDDAQAETFKYVVHQKGE